MQGPEITTISVALIVSVIAPMVLAFFTNRSRRAEKKEDWKRQDEVASMAANAAELLKSNNAIVAATAKATNGKLDQIHTLVNSNMTAAMRAELDATIRELSMMKEVMALHKVAGRQPSQDTLTAIGSTEHKIEELKTTLNDRLEQTKLAEAALKKRE